MSSITAFFLTEIAEVRRKCSPAQPNHLTFQPSNFTTLKPFLQRFRLLDLCFLRAIVFLHLFLADHAEVRRNTLQPPFNFSTFQLYNFKTFPSAFFSRRSSEINRKYTGSQARVPQSFLLIYTCVKGLRSSIKRLSSTLPPLFFHSSCIHLRYLAIALCT
jgi:hypothetical protein